MGTYEGDDLIMLELIKFILTNIKEKPEYFIKCNPEDLKETVYLRILWSPFFEQIFKTSGCIIKIKTGESVYKFTTANKAEAFPNNKKIIGFKIDIRFTVRIDGVHYDFGCGEVGVSDDDKKILEDEGKLVREAKEAIDNLFSNTNIEDDNLCYAYIIQNFSMPSNRTDFKDSAQILEYVLRMKIFLQCQMNQAALAVKKFLNEKHSVGFSLGRGKVMAPNPKVEWLRETWFTPPRNAKPTIPTNLFVSNPRDITAELLH